MKIVILNYTGYRDNWGSQATSRGLLQWVASALMKNEPCDIDIVPYPPSHWIDYWQQSKYGDFLEHLYLNIDTTYSDLKKLETLCRHRFGNLLTRLAQADLVIFQGEGSIGSSRAFQRTQLFGLPVLAKRLYRKKVITINQTISFSTPDQEKKLQSIFSLFDCNYVREKASLDACASVGWPKIEFIPDAAFYYYTPTLNKDNISDDYFCVTGSADLKNYNIAEYAKNIYLISHETGLTPVFIYSRSSDRAVADEYSKITKSAARIVNSRTHLDINQILGILSAAHFVVGGRYHTSISALSLGTPVILTRSNSHKSEGLARLFTHGVHLINYQSAEDFAHASKTIIQGGINIKKSIIFRVNALRQESYFQSQKIHSYIFKDKDIKICNAEYSYPDFRLNNPWRKLSPFKAIFKSINLSIYDRVQIKYSQIIGR